MNHDRWRRIEELCHAAASREPAERAAFLERACEGDADLRREVESLLGGESGAEAFLATPAWRAPALAPGTRLGPHEILQLVGSGGMGEVYKACDTRLDRIVALKVLPADVSSDPERRARFAREAKTISQLSHPNICTLHDIGEAPPPRAAGVGAGFSRPDLQYLVMEFLEGETLASRLTKGSLPLAQALEVGAEIAGALAAAHQHGVVHRDLKPGNVMLTRSGGPSGPPIAKLLDFGLAKLRAPGKRPVMETAASATESEPLTGRGVIVGTLPYMAPEQLEGKPADARTDLWALGTILYEMLAGKRAFEGDSSASLIGAILEREPEPLTARRPLTPPALDRLVRRCLAKDPEERWQSATDVAGELRWLSTRPVARRWRSVAIVAALLATVSAVTWVGLWSGSQAGPEKLDLSAPPRPLTSLPGVEKEPAISPNGRYVAFVWNGSGDGYDHVYVVSVEGGEAFPVTRAPADDATPVWSPGGDRIAFLRRAERRLEVRWASFPVGEEKLLHVLERGQLGLDWSPDGRYLAISDVAAGSGRSAVFLLDLEDETTIQLTHPPPEASTGDHRPVFSPDGQEMAFLRGRQGADSDVFTLRLNGGRPVGEPRQLTSGWTSRASLAWSPDGAELFYISYTSPTVRRVPRRGGLAEGVASARDAHTLAVDPVGGRLVYATADIDTDIWRLPGPEGPADAGRSAFIRSTRDEGAPQYSPNGKRVAFHSNRSGAPNIWVADDEGRNERRLTDLGFAVMPQWSPEGDRLVFQCPVGVDGKGPPTIFVMGVDDVRPTPITQGKKGLGVGKPIWSPDGEWIFFARQTVEQGNDSAQFRLWRIPSVGGEPRLIAKGAPALGVDDRFVYFPWSPLDGSVPRGFWQLWRALHGGGEETLVLRDPVRGGCALWREKLIYIDWFQPDGPALRALDLTTGRSAIFASLAEPLPGSLSDDPTGIYGGLTVSPDGRWILYGRPTTAAGDLMVIEPAEAGRR